MTEITPGLFLGGLGSTSPEFLTPHNVQALVSCCSEFDFGDPPIPMSQFRVPVEDISNEPILDYMDEACQFISANLPLGGVLVHCRSGVSRSATIVIGYLMKTMHLSLNDSFMLVISRRSCICPNIGFMKQLCLLEEVLLGGGDFEAHSNKFTPEPPAEPPESACACCASEPSSPLSVQRQAFDRCATWAAASPPSVPNKDIERLRSLGQALMASQYSSTYSAYGLVSDAPSPSSSSQAADTPQHEEGSESSPAAAARQPFSHPAPPELRVHSAGALSPCRPYPPRVSVSSGPSPKTSYLTPRNAMSCVNSPDNLFRSLAVKSPSLSMSKYISWYTMSGDRASAPSLAP